MEGNSDHQVVEQQPASAHTEHSDTCRRQRHSFLGPSPIYGVGVGADGDVRTSAGLLVLGDLAGMAGFAQTFELLPAHSPASGTFGPSLAPLAGAGYEGLHPASHSEVERSGQHPADTVETVVRIRTPPAGMCHLDMAGNNNRPEHRNRQGM